MTSNQVFSSENRVYPVRRVIFWTKIQRIQFKSPTPNSKQKTSKIIENCLLDEENIFLPRIFIMPENLLVHSDFFWISKISNASFAASRHDSSIPLRSDHVKSVLTHTYSTLHLQQLYPTSCYIFPFCRSFCIIYMLILVQGCRTRETENNSKKFKTFSFRTFLKWGKKFSDFHNEFDCLFCSSYLKSSLIWRQVFELELNDESKSTIFFASCIYHV